MKIVTSGLVLNQPRTLPRLEDVVIDDPGAGEVRVRLSASGVCHTDISAVRDARFWPMLLGHEGAGIVESVGSDVQHVKAGDPVLISWKVSCGQCHNCLRKLPHLCEQVVATDAPRVHRPNGERLHVMLNAGTFCEYCVVPADGAIPIQQPINLEAASIIGCAIATGVGAAIHTADIQAGETCVIFGVGGVGLNIVQGARLAQAGMIIAVDLTDSKLTAARQMGATHTVAADQGDPVQAVLTLTGGRGVDYAFEVVGAPAIMTQTLATLAPGGALVIVGAAARDVQMSFHPRSFMSKQQRILGCIYGGCHPPVDFPQFVDWYAAGQLKVDELVTEYIRLDNVVKCFTEAPAPDAIRTVIRFGK